MKLLTTYSDELTAVYMFVTPRLEVFCSVIAGREQFLDYSASIGGLEIKSGGGRNKEMQCEQGVVDG